MKRPTEDHAPFSRSRLRRVAARILVACTIVVGALVVLEGYFQFQASRERPWDLPAAQRRPVDLDCETGCNVIRSYVPGQDFRQVPQPARPWGYREALPVPADGEFLVREPGVLRIAFLGDSLTEGYGLRDFTEVFTGKLETCLAETRAEATPRIEVANFGIAGHNALDLHASLTSAVLRYQPDIIDYVFFHNDGTDQHMIEAKLATEIACTKAENHDVRTDPPGRWDRLRAWMRMHSALQHQLSSYQGPLFRHRVAIPVADALGRWAPGITESHPYFRSTNSQCQDHKLAAVVLESMVDAAAEQDIAFHITHVPRLGDLMEDQPDRSADLLEWIARERPAVPIFPLRPALEEAVLRGGLAWGDLHIDTDEVHLSAQGHGVVARALCERYRDLAALRIVERGLTPG